MRLWLHLNLRRPQPFSLSRCRTAVIEDFRANRVDFSRQQVLKWALGSECNIFWYFIHEYTLFFVCPGLALGW